MIALLKSLVKFLMMMILTTFICTIAWDAFLNGKVYFCPDGGACDYWFVGDWVQAHNGLPIVVVPEIVPPHTMNDPDTIKAGWSVSRLWLVWIAMFGTSIAASILFAGTPFTATAIRLAGKIKGHAQTVTIRWKKFSRG